MNRYLAITTCNGEQWAQYGRAMATTFCRHWPTDVPLRVYAEGFSGDENGSIEFIDLDEAAPWLAPWKARTYKAHRGYRTGKYRFRDDAVRFSHKVAAIAAAAVTTESDVLIWMDADTVTHSLVTIDWLDQLFPPPADIAWLDRARTYPECGFLMFRLPSALKTILGLRNAYKSGAVFRFAEWHDSWVIQQIVHQAVERGAITVASLSGEGRNSHHPFAVGPLGSRMDHLKGSRKAEGRSRPADFPHRRPEPYWQ